MSFEIEHEVSSEGLLFYWIKGKTTADAMRALALRIQDDAVAAGATGALLDCAGMTGALEITSLVEVGEFFANTLPTIRLAAVNTPPYWGYNRVSEGVISKSGGQLMHFTSRESALHWLLDT